MTRQIVVLLTLAVIALGCIFIVTPKAAGTPDQASAMDIIGLTKAAKNLPEPKYPTY